MAEGAALPVYGTNDVRELGAVDEEISDARQSGAFRASGRHAHVNEASPTDSLGCNPAGPEPAMQGSGRDSESASRLLEGEPLTDIETSHVSESGMGGPSRQPPGPGTSTPPRPAPRGARRIDHPQAACHRPRLRPRPATRTVVAPFA